jgi:septum site-determining protein MinC
MLDVQEPRRASEPAPAPVSAPFQLKGSSFKLMVLKVTEPEHPRFFLDLERTIRQAPSFFHRQPIVLDLADTALERIELETFVAALRELMLLPVGIQTAPTLSGDLERRARAIGLPLLPAGRPKTEPAAAEDSTANAAATATDEAAAEKQEPQHEEPAARASMMIREPVRSGRQVYAHKADLIVLGPVSPGAELLADGHIHVYDTLRGRALAGLSGDRTARIFCRKLEAELVSIAGMYKVSEDIDRSFWKSSAQIHLEAERLCFQRLP